ncbi:MAG: hypothetical protein HN417_11805, partial [Desulfobacula sp.]|nr:hypothetical protein [Desulfobacula sp.]
MFKNAEFKYGKDIFTIEVPDKADPLRIREPDFHIIRENFADDFSLCLTK